MAKIWGRIFDCHNCKAKLDRDYNASLNIALRNF
ncbi:zinc ribbon domain-containing protein [Campylobacter sp.]|nr:zinc ribbon domain-containing protein [Campylobacter sp.]MCI6178471.1 transposase [Campylobacter sp.]MCI6565658.1 transposase [Campylobacter sp.]MCI7501050.1 transposase [Campylobacter sp.]MDY3245469.1 zinc ribbon domain-containing protein [Campylobacter sp.]MDY4012672.1 zinc ribbon domain-containing protein [Campylobacter sp.]